MSGLNDAILAVLTLDGPLSTEETAARAKRGDRETWRALYDMELEGRITRRRLGHTSVWRLAE